MSDGTSKRRGARYSKEPDAFSERQNIALEMEQRRAKPNPAARPLAKDSAALATLRRDLHHASGAERERIAAAIRNLEACYRPSAKPPREAPRKPAGEPSAAPVIDSGLRTPANGRAASVTVIGNPCRVCGGRLRYRNGGLCVACQRIKCRRGRTKQAA